MQRDVGWANCAHWAYMIMWGTRVCTRQVPSTTGYFPKSLQWIVYKLTTTPFAAARTVIRRQTTHAISHTKDSQLSHIDLVLEEFGL